MERSVRHRSSPWEDVLAHDCASSIVRLRKGFPTALGIRVATALRLTKSELWARLHLPNVRKTQSSGGQLLSSVESERIYRIAKLHSLASQVLGDDEDATLWLLRRNRVLGGEDPLALLDTQVGYELVTDTLNRMQFGTVA